MESLRRIASYWVAIVVSVPTAVLAVIQLIGDNNESAYFWFMIAAFGLVAALALELIRVRRERRVPAQQVFQHIETYNHFEAGAAAAPQIPRDAPGVNTAGTAILPPQGEEGSGRPPGAGAP
jgi:predicted outer membrane lipoprotein